MYNKANKICFASPESRYEAPTAVRLYAICGLGISWCILDAWYNFSLGDDMVGYYGYSYECCSSIFIFVSVFIIFAHILYQFRIRKYGTFLVHGIVLYVAELASKEIRNNK